MEAIYLAQKHDKPNLQGTYTLDEVAQLMNCSMRHARRYDAERKIPGRLTFGRLVRFSRKRVDAWLNESGPTT